jgi:hypothetical protein
MRKQWGSPNFQESNLRLLFNMAVAKTDMEEVPEPPQDFETESFDISLKKYITISPFTLSKTKANEAISITTISQTL